MRARADAETQLPPLGPVPEPVPSIALREALEPPEAPLEAFEALAVAPLAAQDAAISTPVRSSTASPQGGGQGSPRRDRLLAGEAYIPAAAAAGGNRVGPDPDAAEARRPGESTDSRNLADWLRSEPVTTARASLLPTQRLLLGKGTFIDCTLQTAIDSTLPGMTTCVTATDTFGIDGREVLLERGTRLIGETRGQARQGSARIFVLWTEARTPAGIVVPLDSPGTDELGRSGLQGEVDRHFWDRFGAAILVSTIDGAVQATVQRSRGSGAVVISPSTSQSVLTEVLRDTIDIPPTITKRQGERIQVLVARDLDFRAVRSP